MDPGLLTLGALAVGAAALLPQLSKKAKEGFDVVPVGNYPQTVETGKELFNKLTLASDPRSEAVRVDALPEAEQNAYKAAVDSATATNNVTFSSTGANLSQAETTTPVHLPGDDSILKRIAFCQTTPVNESVFQNAQFARDCGVCVTKGRLADNKEFNGAKGLFVDPESRKEIIRDAESKNESYTRGKPTYGYCEGATGGVDHNYSFALTPNELKLLTQRHNCQIGRTFEDGNCATCLKDGTYTFVGKSDRSLDPITFHIFARNAILDANLGGTKPDFQFPNDVRTLVGLNVSAKFSIILNEGAFLNFNLTGFSGVARQVSGQRRNIPNKWVVSEFWGLIEFPNSTGGVERIPLDRILLKDEVTGTTPRYAKNFEVVNGIYCRKMIKRSGQDSMILSGQVPFLLMNNAPFEGIDCKASLLQTLPSSVEKFGGDPCYKPATQGPGTWTDACLRDRIQTLGCTTNGGLYKDPSQLRNLTMTQMIQAIQETVSKQYSDNENSMKCNGRNISTPCDPYVNFDPEETPELSEQCISFLYFNRGAEKPNIGPTYTGPTGTFFSLDKDGKRIMCLPGAQMDPAAGNKAMMDLFKRIYRSGFQGVSGLAAVKRYMDINFNTAINSSLNANQPSTRGGRKDFIERCFTSLANIPENVLPDKKLPNARFCRVRYPPGVAQCIQISQIAIFDNRDTNVAFGKKATATSTWANGRDGAVPEKAVDGQLRARGHPNEFHSQCRANDFWLLDMGKTYPIKRVEYYNRTDCCWTRANGMLLELLDEKMNIVWAQTLDGNWKQVYYTFLKNYNV